MTITNSIIYGNVVNGVDTTIESQILENGNVTEYRHNLIGNSRDTSGLWTLTYGLDLGGNIDTLPMIIDYVDFKLNPFINYFL